MYIISEASSVRTIPKKLKSLKEGRIRLKVGLQTGDVINRNRRRYSKGLLENGVKSVSERVKEGSFLGELDHPTDKQNPSRQITILYKEASHKFCELGWEGNKLVSVIETLRTPNGTILKNLAEDGVPVGFSFRGMGDLRQCHEGGKTFYEVQGPLHVITWDAVSYPSHDGARLIEITEGVTKMIYESTGLTESADGMICTEEGHCYFPNDFDKLVEQRIFRLTNKFQI